MGAESLTISMMPEGNAFKQISPQHCPSDDLCGASAGTDVLAAADVSYEAGVFTALPGPGTARAIERSA